MKPQRDAFHYASFCSILFTRVRGPGPSQLALAVWGVYLGLLAGRLSAFDHLAITKAPPEIVCSAWAAFRREIGVRGAKKPVFAKTKNTAKVREISHPACAGGSCSNGRVAAYRLAWRLAPPLGPLFGPLPRMSPLETSLTQSEPLPL